MNISPSILKEAQRQALMTAMRMQQYWQRNLLHSWRDVEKHFSITIDDRTKAMPFNYSNFSLFRDIWKNSVEARLKAATESAREEIKIKVDHEEIRFGQVKLFPEQVGCFKALRSAFIGAAPERRIKAALQDGYMGSGKSYIGGALAAELVTIENILKDPIYSLLPHPIIIFTPKGVVEHWKRVLESLGLGQYVANRKIYVFSNGEFNTSIGEMFCPEIEDDITGDTSLEWTAMLTPVMALLDECHNYIRPKSIRTRKIIALFKAQKRMASRFPMAKVKPFSLFMSATPMEKVNDARTFCIAVDTDFMGVHVNEETFNYFARLIDREPHKPNREAVKRLRNVLAPYIFSIPYVKPKFKAVNRVWCVDFLTEGHAKIYATAHQRYIDACRRSGKNTSWGQFEVFIELNNYRKTVEPLRAGHLAARAAENYHSGKLATAIGCAFKETVAETIFQLVDRYRVPREHISLVWGGKRQYRTEDLLTKEEVDKLLREGLDNLFRDRQMLKRLRITLRYLQDQHEHEENTEQQAKRHSRLLELGLLGKQNDNARQIEIDKFQDGSSRICIFTLASGGVGLSFDRDKELLLPREGLFTPVYNGKEFQQVLGRLVRRASLADANQYICMMKGTVEEHHVAPILDSKLKCIAEITNRNFDIIDLLSREVAATDGPIKLRSDDEVIKDAENDDTIVTDFVSREDEDEEEDLEEIETIEDVLKV